MKFSGLKSGHHALCCTTQRLCCDLVESIFAVWGCVGVCVFTYSQQDSCRPYGNSICPSDASARESCAGRRRPAPRTSSFGHFTAAKSVCKCFIVVHSCEMKHNIKTAPMQRAAKFTGWEHRVLRHYVADKSPAF